MLTTDATIRIPVASLKAIRRPFVPIDAGHPIYEVAAKGDFYAVQRFVEDLQINPNCPSEVYKGKSALDLLNQNYTGNKKLNPYAHFIKVNKLSAEDWYKEFGARVKARCNQVLVPLRAASLPAVLHQASVVKINSKLDPKFSALIQQLAKANNAGKFYRTLCEIDSSLQVMNDVNRGANVAALNKIKFQKQSFIEYCWNRNKELDYERGVERRGISRGASPAELLSRPGSRDFTNDKRECSDLLVQMAINCGLNWADNISMVEKMMLGLIYFDQTVTYSPWLPLTPFQQADRLGRAYGHYHATQISRAKQLSDQQASSLECKFSFKGIPPQHRWHIPNLTGKDLFYLIRAGIVDPNQGDELGIPVLHYIAFLNEDRPEILSPKQWFELCYPRNGKPKPILRQFAYGEVPQYRGLQIDDMSVFGRKPYLESELEFGTYCKNIRAIDFNVQGLNGNTLAHYYAMDDERYIDVPFLHGCGASLSIVNKDGFTPLHLLAARGYWDWFLNDSPDNLANENLNIADPMGKTLAVYAAQQGKFEEFRDLVRAGAEPNMYWSENGQQVYTWDLLEKYSERPDWYDAFKARQILVKKHYQLI